MPRHSSISGYGGFPPDKGCEVSSKCIDCPLPYCKYDEPERYSKLLQVQRDGRIIASIMQDNAVKQVAKVEGITERTVYRILTNYGVTPNA